ncbi:MAG: hypothetical protein WC880_05220 [Candidatus Paceibacterota bacterium]
MTFNWLSYLELAGDPFLLDKTSPEEARLRTCISRAYYSVHHIAAEFLENEKGIVLCETKDIHNQVIIMFRDEEYTDNRYKRIGINLDRLRMNRNVADYNGKKHVHFGDAELTLEMAKQVVDDLIGVGATT